MDGHYVNERERTVWSIHETTPSDSLVLGGDLTIQGTTTLKDTDIVHVADQDNDHAFSITTDSGTYSSTNAVQINYKIDSPDNSTSVVQDISINCMDSNATSTVFGHCVAMSGGLVKGYGMKTGLNVGPIYSVSGSFINASLITLNGAIDKTAELSSQGAPYTSCFPVLNDTLEIWGAASTTFMQIGFDIETAANASIQPRFEFSTGAGTWAVFSPNDGTVGMRYTGNVSWRLEDIPGWTAVGGVFGVRITRLKNNLTTLPLIDQISIDSSTIYQWDKDGFLDIHSTRLNKRLDIDCNDAQNVTNHMLVSNSSNPSSFRYSANSSRTSLEIGNNSNLNYPANIDIVGGKGLSDVGGNQTITLKSDGGNNYTIGRKKADNTFRINYDGAVSDYLATDANTALTVNSSLETEVKTLKLTSVANDNTETKLLVWDGVSKMIEYRDVSSLPGGGGGPVNPFDQDLNTTNSVKFQSVSLNDFAFLSSTDGLTNFNQIPSVTTGIKYFKMSSNTSDNAVIIHTNNANAAATAHCGVLVQTDSALCAGNGGNNFVIYESCGGSGWTSGRQKSTNTFRWNYVVGPSDYLTTDANTKMFLDSSGNLTTTGNIACSTIDTGLGATDVYLMNQNIRTSDTCQFNRIGVGSSYNGSSVGHIQILGNATDRHGLSINQIGSNHSVMHMRSFNSGINGLAFGAYDNGGGWVSSNLNGNCLIEQSDGVLNFYSKTGVSVGSSITWVRPLYLDTTGVRISTLSLDVPVNNNAATQLLVMDGNVVKYRDVSSLTDSVGFKMAGITLNSAFSTVTNNGVGVDSVIANADVTNLVSYADTGYSVSLVNGTIVNTSGVTRTYELSISTNINIAGAVAYGIRSYVSIDGVAGAVVTEIIRSEVDTSLNNCCALQNITLQNNGYVYIGIRNITNGTNLGLIYLDIKLKAVY